MSLTVMIAVGGAFYTHALGINDARGRQTIGDACVIGNLQGASNCSTTITSNRCQVQIQSWGGGMEIVPAYSLSGTCQSTEALYRPAAE